MPTGLKLRYEGKKVSPYVYLPAKTWKNMAKRFDEMYKAKHKK